MPTPPLPEGLYYTLNHKMVPSTGGRTRTLMMRNRILRERYGVEPYVLSLDDNPSHAATREYLVDHGELVDGVHMLNLFEWLRERDLTELDAVGENLPSELPPLEHTFCEEVAHPDGTTYYTSYRTRNTLLEVARDYRRPDGSVFLRAPSTETVFKDTPLFLVDSTGRLLRRWSRLGQLQKFWLKQLAGDAERIFVVCDRRTVLPELLPFGDPRFLFFLVLHNSHLIGAGKHWSSPVVPDYLPALEGIRHLDGLVTLTEEQRGDIAARCGETDNLVVVPNATELRDLPDPLPPRDPARFTIVARIDPQKRLQHAVEAFARVVEQRPQAHLDIYGEGRILSRIADHIERRGMADHITLKGHDPRAREALLTSSGFLMTSLKEGYPMATLEALSFGCPVVSYDCKYGPAEQVTDGVDGFLVPSGDIDAFAQRVIQLIDDPALVERLSKGALAKAGTLTWDSFAQRWIDAFTSAAERKPGRVRALEPELTVHEIGWLPAVRAPAGLERLGRVGRAGRRLTGLRAAANAFRRSPRFGIVATVRLLGKVPKDALDDARITLDAVSAATGEVVSLPLTVDRHARAFRLRSEFDLRQALDDLSEEATDLRLRLRVVVRNWAWETEVARPGDQVPALEVVYDSAGAVELHRSPR